ncbi:glycosyltransferase family 4 protein [Ignavibacteria bacterium 4148-Me]|uniref:glycosyltransferase family 4 protein n=1 Tax=Rosettibacter primus TaxID=3111523 RepID=UPI00336BEB24
MKILQVHNYYQLSGGEDTVFNNEYKLLSSFGHDVIQYTKDNKDISNYSFFDKRKLFFNSVYSKSTYMEVIKIIEEQRPDVCHVHNTLALITPSVYYACKKIGVPIVQTLHNYRLICTNAYLFRNGKVCEECIGKSLYNSVKHGCYRNSRLQTFVLARTIEWNKKKGTWNNLIDAYIALTEFSKRKFIEGGLPENKIFIKPNFLFEDPGCSENNEGYFLFAGRLDETKGVNVLIEAANTLPNLKFKVAGDGPLKEKIIAVPNIKYLGQLKKNELLGFVQKTTALVFSSIWFEAMPMIILEAFACGKPVIASNLGAMAEIIEHGKTGLLFEPGNANDLVEKILWAKNNPEKMIEMGLNARKEFEEKYTPAKNYEILMEIYEKVRKWKN